MSLAFNRAIAHIQLEEGGVGTLDDGMGLTRYGQTAIWLKQYNLPAPETLEQAADNWRVWGTLLKYDLICDCLLEFGSAALGAALMDFAVNTSDRLAITTLQKLVGVKVDGIIGTTETVPAVKLFLFKHKDWLTIQLTIARMRLRARQFDTDPKSRQYAANAVRRLADILEELTL